MGQIEENSIFEVYQAVVDYHNRYNNIRFTIAGLFLTGSAFLINVFFNIDTNMDNYFIKGFSISILGLFLSIIILLLEFRTKHLLDNSGKFGKEIEDQILKGIYLEGDFKETRGLFHLTYHQPIPPKKINGQFANECAGHSIMLFYLYIIFIFFWLLAIIFLFGKIITQNQITYDEMSFIVP